MKKTSTHTTGDIIRAIRAVVIDLQLSGVLKTDAISIVEAAKSILIQKGFTDIPESNKSSNKFNSMAMAAIILCPEVIGFIDRNLEVNPDIQLFAFYS